MSTTQESFHRQLQASAPAEARQAVLEAVRLTALDAHHRGDLALFFGDLERVRIEVLLFSNIPRRTRAFPASKRSNPLGARGRKPAWPLEVVDLREQGRAADRPASDWSVWVQRERP